MQNFDDLFSPQPTGQEDTSFDRDAWAAKKQAEREGVYARIDTYVAEMVQNGDLFQAYLDVQARFDRYSVSNAILVASQMPTAMRLADFNTWKASGVYIKRGMDALTILEPGKEYTKDDGSIGVSYNVKKVFDVSQTNSHQRTISAAARDPRLLLKALMNHAPCRFAVSDKLPEGVNVTYRREDNMLLVRQGLDAATLFRGISQGLARAHLERGGYPCQVPEFVSYSVSYMLCRRNGISVEGFSFDRLPQAYGAMDTKAIRAEVSMIREISSEITADMNRLFAAQEKNKRDRDDGAR